MPSHIREGSDYVACRSCGDKFNLNDPKRDELDGSRYQYYCYRCAKREEIHSKISCIICGDFHQEEDMQWSWHSHPEGTIPVPVCSQECTIRNVVRPGGGLFFSFGKVAGNAMEHHPPDTFGEIKREYNEEIDDLSDNEVVNLKFVAISAAFDLRNSRLDAYVNTSISIPEADLLPLILTHKTRDITDEFVKRFHLKKFNTPLGEKKLIMDDPEKYHQGFGVTLFEYEDV